jgi:hypothetical protein
VVYPRSRSYQLDERVRVVPLEQFASADLGILLRAHARRRRLYSASERVRS